MSMEKKEEKKERPKATIKIDWIFGIRKDIHPNILMMDKSTMIYPAGNYLISYSYNKDRENQHFVEGTPYSKGFYNLAKKSYGTRTFCACEDTEDECFIRFFVLTTRSGIMNMPDEIQKVAIKEHNFTYYIL